MTTEPNQTPSSTDNKIPRSNHIALILILVGFLAVLAAIIGAQFLGKSGEPIADARLPVQDACKDARSELVSFGLLDDQMDFAALADRIDAETAVMRAMVAKFEATSTGNEDGQRAFEAWIADWSALLDARDAAVVQVRDGHLPTAWLPPEEVGKSVAIDGRMDEYSRREDVRDCTTDVLAADTLDGQRFYRTTEY